MSDRSQEDSPCTRTADAPGRPKRSRQTPKTQSSRGKSGSSSRFSLLRGDRRNCQQLDGGDGCTPSARVSTGEHPVLHVSLCQRRRYQGRKAKLESLLDPRFVGRTCDAINQPEEYLNHSASVSHCRTGTTWDGSAHLYAFHAQQGTQLFQLARGVTNSNRTVMRGAVDIPLIHKLPGAQRKAVSAVRVADFQNWTSH